MQYIIFNIFKIFLHRDIAYYGIHIMAYIWNLQGGGILKYTVKERIFTIHDPFTIQESRNSNLSNKCSFFTYLYTNLRFYIATTGNI